MVQRLIMRQDEFSNSDGFEIVWAYHRFMGTIQARTQIMKGHFILDHTIFDKDCAYQSISGGKVLGSTILCARNLNGGTIDLWYRIRMNQDESTSLV